MKNLTKEFSINGYFLNTFKNDLYLNYSRINNLNIKFYQYNENTKFYQFKENSYIKSYFNPLEKIELNGKNYPCPNNLDKFIQEQYGFLKGL